MNNNSSNALIQGQMALQQQQQQQVVPVNLSGFGMNYQAFAPSNGVSNVCFQSFVPSTNVQNLNMQQQMLMAQNIAPVQNVNILQQQPRVPQTQFVFVMNSNDNKSQLPLQAGSVQNNVQI